MNATPRFARPVVTAGYRHAVDWITTNDTPTRVPRVEALVNRTTVRMVADLFCTTPAVVARDVARAKVDARRAEEARLVAARAAYDADHVLRCTRCGERFLAGLADAAGRCEDCAGVLAS